MLSLPSAWAGMRLEREIWTAGKGRGLKASEVPETQRGQEALRVRPAWGERRPAGTET